MSIKPLIEKCEELYNDLSFSAVKKWKEKNRAKAIGFMPVYVPREIIHAAGMLPVGVMGGGSNLEIIKGDAYFQSYICHIPRSTIELGLAGKLDDLDGMLFPAICDVIRNLSGMWQTLFKGKYVKFVDLPQNFNKGIGGEFYRFEIEDMIHHFEQISGNKVTKERLAQSIALYNENRRAISRLYAMRSELPHLVSTYELYLLMRASNILDVSEHTAMLETYMKEVQKEKRPELDNVRVIITGTFCEQPPIDLIRAFESSGCYVVDDDWVLGARYINEDIAEIGDPIQAIANAYLGNTVSTASKYENNRKKGEYLVQKTKSLKAEGVIFCSPSFCDPALLDRPMLCEAFTRENIPYTSFKYSENSGQIRVFKEQTGTFADSIKLWGGV